MAFLGAIVGGVASAAGSVIGAMGQAQASQAQADAKRLEALNQRMKGTAEQGAKTYEALDLDKQREQVVSNQRAAFAASGGGLGGTARYVMDKTNQVGMYKENMTIWEGQELRRNREVQAVQLEHEAEALDQAASIQRLSGIVSGISGVASAFGGFGSKGGMSAVTSEKPLYYS